MEYVDTNLRLCICTVWLVQCLLISGSSSSLVTAASRFHVHPFSLTQEGSRVQTGSVFKIIFRIPA